MVKKKVIKLVKPKPTLKQKKLLQGMVENVGKKGTTKSVGKLMKEAGYTDAMAKNPHKVTQTKTFQQLLDDTIPDSLIIGKIREAFDLPARHFNSPRFVEMSLKLKKHLNPMGEEILDAFKTMVQFQIPAHKELPK